MSYGLTDAEKKIKKFLDDHHKNQYNTKQIAIHIGHKVGYVRNLLMSNGRLLTNHLINKIKKGNNSFFQGIEKKFLTTLDYIDQEVKSVDLKNALCDILLNQYPLGIHYLQCDREDPNLKNFYNTCNWKSYKKGNKAKYYELKGIDEYGKTTILIFEGKTKGKSPKIQLLFSGHDSPEKTFLKEDTYSIWYKIVESNLKNLIGINYNLDSFNITQMEFNYDLDLNSYSSSFRSVNRVRNVKMKTLNNVIEIYSYETQSGTKLRIGNRISSSGGKMNKNLMANRGLDDFLSFNQKTVDSMNYVIEQGNKIPILEKQNRAIINQLNNYKDIASKTLTIFPKAIDNNSQSIKDMKNAIGVVPSQLSFIISELDLYKKDIESFKQSLEAELKIIESELNDDTKIGSILVNVVDKISDATKNNSETTKNNSDTIKVVNKGIEKIRELTDSNFHSILDLINIDKNNFNKRIDKSDDNMEQIITLLKEVQYQKYTKSQRRLFRRKEKGDSTLQFIEETIINRLKDKGLVIPIQKVPEDKKKER